MCSYTIAMVKENTYSTFDVRLRAVHAVEDGIPISEVAKSYQAHRSTIYRWWNRYCESLEDGIARKKGSGRPRSFAELNGSKFIELILSSALSFGYESDLWTCRRIQEAIKIEFGLNISKCTVWRRLKEAGLTYQKPEKKYFESSDEERKKWQRYELPKIRRTVGKYRAILYFQDESNIELGALIGKTWSPKGKTPVCKTTGKRGGVSALSSITKAGGLIFKLHTKRIASEEVIEFLQQMLNHHRKRHLVVVMDRATPHTSNRTKKFINNQKRLHVFYLPKYSPDWNPDEKLWNHLKHHEPGNHQVKTKEDLKILTKHKLDKLAHSPETLRGIFFRCCVADFLK